MRTAVSLCLLAACSRSTPTDAGVAASPSASVATVDAALPVVDLLWATDAKVAVSSKVQNAHDRPAHLVDHKPDTAWNSKTGDLVGAWIQFRVPADSSVQYLAITVGFDKKTDKEDLFTENHRISKLRVTHDGTSRDVDLDANVRTPQRIEIGARGGTYELRVLAVVPGTKPSWRELVVSELAVMGTTPRAKANASPPEVNVGTLESTVAIDDAYAKDTRAPTYEAACAKLVADDDQEAKAIGTPDALASCGPPKTKLAGKGAILEIAEVPFTSATLGMRNAFDGDLLALRTASGVVLTSERLSGHERTVNPVTDYRIVQEGWSGDDWVLDVEAKTTTWEDGYVPPDPEDGAHVDHGPWYAVHATHVVCSSVTATCKATHTKKD